MTPFRPLARTALLSALVVVLLGVWLLLTKVVQPDSLCGRIGYECLVIDLNADARIERGSAKIASAELRLEAIDESQRLRRPVANRTVSGCPLPCRIAIRYAADAVSADERVVVNATGILDTGDRVASPADTFVLTFGSGSRADVALVPEVWIDKTVHESFAEALPNGDLALSSPGVPSTGIPLEGGQFAVVSFLKGDRMVICESATSQSSLERTCYLVVGNRLAAAQVTSAEENQKSRTLVVWAPDGRPKTIAPSATAVPARGLRPTPDQLRSSFEVLSRLLASSGALDPGRRELAGVGVYKFGSGSNTIVDCLTGNSWWVTGDAGIVSNLQSRYLEVRQAKGDQIMINYRGQFVQSLQASKTGVVGEIALDYFSIVSNEAKLACRQ